MTDPTAAPLFVIGTRVLAVSFLGAPIDESSPIFNVTGTVTETLKWPGPSGARQFRVRFDNRKVRWFSEEEIVRAEASPSNHPAATVLVVMPPDMLDRLESEKANPFK